jgi:hypothetical protein
VAFGYAADCRVATHLPDGVSIYRDERGPRSDARGNVSRFAARVPSTDYNNIESHIHHFNTPSAQIKINKKTFAILPVLRRSFSDTKANRYLQAFQ